jgi:hypothetical protein
MAADKPCHGQPCSAEFILPPLGILVFRPVRAADQAAPEAEAAPEKTTEKPEITALTDQLRLLNPGRD